MEEFSVWSYFANASFIVQLVMISLMVLSIISWTFIIQHGKYLRAKLQELEIFEQQFWSASDLTSLFQKYQKRSGLVGLSHLFVAGFREFARKQEFWLPNVNRAMKVAKRKDVKVYERHLNFLATVGSTSPYIGLFGTVWGIMHALYALGSAKHVTVATVAPGISETLIATALGLFAAIPAVIAYNRFNHTIEKIERQYEIFQAELTNILSRANDDKA